MVDVNQIALDGIGALNATFASDLDNKALGKAVKISGNKTVDATVAGDAVHGKVVHVEKDGAVVVQLKGYMKVSYSGASGPTVGYAKLSADGTGGVKVDGTTGREYLVLDVDTTNKIVGLFL